jgi:hypothetical protein
MMTGGGLSGIASSGGGGSLQLAQATITGAGVTTTAADNPAATDVLITKALTLSAGASKLLITVNGVVSDTVVNARLNFQIKLNGVSQAIWQGYSDFAAGTCELHRSWLATGLIPGTVYTVNVYWSLVGGGTGRCRPGTDKIEYCELELQEAA